MEKWVKSGYILSFTALIWLIANCYGHCALISSKSVDSHECCKTNNAQNQQTAKSNSLPDKSDSQCKSLSDEYSIVSKVQIDSVQSIDKHHYDIDVNLTFQKDKFSVYLAQLNHSPPKFSFREIFLTSSNSPHAPPVLI